jgi:hypothetical protein
MKVKFFKDAIGFSFWNHYGKPHGTAIQFRRLKPGLFGIQFARDFSGEIYGLNVGLWWNWNVQLLAVHENQFK